MTAHQAGEQKRKASHENGIASAANVLYVHEGRCSKLSRKRQLI